jgi:hypothetical protein
MLTSDWFRTKDYEMFLYNFVNRYYSLGQARKLDLEATGFSQRRGGDRRSLDHPDHLKLLCPKELVDALSTDILIYTRLRKGVQ